jgi:hypothetical protein
MLFSEDDWAKLNLHSFQLLAGKISYNHTPADTERLFKCLQSCSTLRKMKLECLPEKYMKILTGFTWLEELDLVNSVAMKNTLQRSVLQLSHALPNTQIMYGYQLSTSTKRSGSNHWRSTVYYECDPFSYLY